MCFGTVIAVEVVNRSKKAGLMVVNKTGGTFHIKFEREEWEEELEVEVGIR